MPDDAEVEVISSDLRRTRHAADETAKAFGIDVSRQVVSLADTRHLDV